MSPRDECRPNGSLMKTLGAMGGILYMGVCFHLLVSENLALNSSANDNDQLQIKYEDNSSLNDGFGNI
ncbi:hypothetical protein CEXT_304971 [Caerostris extrusa]|uniref:Uncharacterized protein n=1 Tax=Caerostris extrusa TaxID=172846 RepID=A0AAV4R6P5_CAEEX|nr:hypothetical protein CEXT_304971 [Caerostris extrusa]